MSPLLAKDTLSASRAVRRTPIASVTKLPRMAKITLIVPSTPCR
jgi:hypothetical protein